MLVSSPVACILGVAPVAALVKVSSFTADEALSKIAISLSDVSVIFTLPSAEPPVPPLINTSPDALVDVPLPPFNTRSPASEALEAPPETVNEVSSSPIMIEAPPELSLINTLPFVPCASNTRLTSAALSSGSTALTTTLADVLDTCNLVLSFTFALSISNTEVPAVSLNAVT